VALLTPRQYDALERAVADRRRVAVWRRGGELVVVAHALRMRDGREWLHATHPTTGEPLVLALDDLDRVEVVR
jgi:hypothetical protein